MAQKIQVLLIDDLTGKEANETVTFALDGATYEIDLSKQNASKLRALLANYVNAGRKAGGRLSRGHKPKRASANHFGSSTAQIRAWARENGYEVNDRGRIPADIIFAYKDARK